jgi:hypothetical protein
MRKIQQRKKLSGVIQSQDPTDDFDFDAARPINTHSTSSALLAASAGESFHETVNGNHVFKRLHSSKSIS